MSEGSVAVKIDDRARLVMAVLAAGDWPELEQAQAPHAVHTHSKLVRRHVQNLRDHPAVVRLNEALRENIAISELFSCAIRCQWPDLLPVDPLPKGLEDGEWPKDLVDFHQASTLESFWAEHQAVWEETRSELEAVFRGHPIISFLERVGGQSEARPVSVVPAIVFPMLRPVLAESSSEIQLILPPAKAWGESPPWPFGEDPAWTIAQSCRHLVPLFLRNTLSQLDATRRALLQHAMVILCLEQEFDQAEAMAYMVRIKKEEALPQLPVTVESVREFSLNPMDATLVDVV